jgi:1,4-alpha-glucan branching enzyme
MKYFVILFQLINISFFTYSQVVVTNPLLPTDKQQTVVTFYADQGNKGLMNYTGDIYAHTGVITDKSASGSEWKFLKASWTINKDSCKLTKTATNQYQLTLAPSIREFYNVPSSEKILKLAFVFRSSDGSKTGREAGDGNILVTVYEEGVNVSFAKPSGLFTLASEAQSIPIEVNASGHDSIQLYLDNQYVKSSVTSPLTYSVNATGIQKHILVAKAYKNPKVATDTAYYVVKGTTETAALPAGYRDGITYPDNQSASFVIYAPYKKNIYLIGDFNQWVPDNNYLMKKDGDRFWLTLNGLTPGKEYIFQYLIDDTLRVADPYCDKVSDPWNDKYISSTIYPNLVSYPDTKTSEIASVIQPGQTEYSWQNTSFTPPAKEKLIIYELLIRDFTANKDIKTVKDTLAYLKKLGINAIELMPFNEFEGNDSWGYNPSFYFAPDKAYGTKTDYKKFIDACHQNGIAVIQDLVLNHSYGSSSLVRMYFANGAPTAQNPWYNQTSNMQNPDAQWGYDFNHQSIYTQKLVDSITSYWMSEYKIDGFRFDFTKGFTNTFYGPTSWASDYDASRIVILKRMASAIWKRKANAYVIFEHLAVNDEETELANYGIMLWGNMNYNYNQATMGYSEGWDFSGISYIQRSWNQPNEVGYMESHDEERLMYKNITYGNSNTSYNIKDLPTALKRMEMAASFFLTIPGPKMIWQFGELGYDISRDYNGKLTSKPLHWEYYFEANRHRIFRVYSFLNQLKKENPLFSTSNFTMDVSGALKTTTLISGNDYAFIVGNFDITSKTATLTFPATGKWYDYFTGDSINLTEITKSTTLSAGEYHLYSNKKLAGFPAHPLSVKNIQKTDIKIYPNPCNDFIAIESSIKPEKTTIQTSDGRLLLSQLYQNENMDVRKYPAGIYFLTLYFKHNKMVYKIIKE